MPWIPLIEEVFEYARDPDRDPDSPLAKYHEGIAAEFGETWAKAKAKSGAGSITRRGHDHANAKFSDEEIREIRRRHIPYEVSYVTLGVEYGVSYRTIANIIKRRTYKHVD